MSVHIARSVISLGVCIVFDYSRVKLTFLRRNLICLWRMYCRWCHSLLSLSYESDEVDSHLITLWRNRHDFGFRSYFIVRRFEAVLGG